MKNQLRMGLAMGRGQVIRITAISALVLIWVVHWQWSNLTGDLSWVNKSYGSEASRPPASSVVKGLGQPLPTDIDLSDPDAPFIGWPLKRVCNEVEEWTKGVVFVCDNNFGGVGNVRNFILTCVRYAIEAGATGMVMPLIRKRRDDNIKIITDPSDFRPFSYLFDEQNFREAMAENCPQITIYDTWFDVPNLPLIDGNASQPYIEKVDFRELDRPDTKRCDFAELDHQTDRFQVRFKEFLHNPENGTVPSARNPRLFRGTDWPGVLWEWPVWRDGPELANTFAGLCKFNKTMMRLGKLALAKMQEFGPQNPGDLRVGHEESSKFLGVHLRTEADALDFWPTYEEQEEAYLGKAAEVGLAVGYIASGNLTEAHKFSTAAEAELGMKMVSKDDLLDGPDLEELHSLSWDQQGLVDYIVLTAADYFTGNSRSSFSISVTKKRHLKSEGLYSRPYKVRPNGYDRSFIVGPMTMYYEHWLFIWDAMWP
ncbi:hypothetical protein N0V93_004687 [Gnomoniopsis smithogilvyi]|uniref:Alternative oxidase n=1 Tax=Gnomoniopsis smithogilvyi TaxID=1191159 RepID=A0A9W8YTA7_9PEZI|nr:hypothetical protein N0V93_004687 [Gnomoniopsis smithogilvyi]